MAETENKARLAWLATCCFCFLCLVVLLASLLPSFVWTKAPPFLPIAILPLLPGRNRQHKFFLLLGLGTVENMPVPCKRSSDSNWGACSVVRLVIHISSAVVLCFVPCRAGMLTVCWSRPETEHPLSCTLSTRKTRHCTFSLFTFLLRKNLAPAPASLIKESERRSSLFSLLCGKTTVYQLTYLYLMADRSEYTFEFDTCTIFHVKSTTNFEARLVRHEDKLPTCLLQRSLLLLVVHSI